MLTNISVTEAKVVNASLRINNFEPFIKTADWKEVENWKRNESLDWWRIKIIKPGFLKREKQIEMV